MEWTKVSDETLPKPKTVRDGKCFLQEASAELLCFDGETVFTEFYGHDTDGDRLHLLKNVTHYIRIDEIETPKD